MKFTLGLVATILAVTSFSALSAIDYDEQIAPIFRSYCAGCHNEREWEGDFSLETYASLREGGDKGDPVVPGDASKSYLIKVIEGHSKPKMPPKDEPQVPASELERLKAWIAEGAKGPAEDRSLYDHLVVPNLPASSVEAPITAIAHSADGSKRAVGRYARIDILKGGSEEVTLTLTEVPGKVNALEFSPQGDALLVASGITGLKGIAQLWDVETGELLREFGQHHDVLYDATFSPDGTLIATAGYDTTIHLWDRQAGTLLRSLTAHQEAVFDLCFHPNGRILASASADETVKLWRVADGTRLDTLSQPQGSQVGVCFAGDHVISAGADKRLHQWRLVSLKEPKINPVEQSRFAHETGITALLKMPDGKHLLSAAEDRTIKVWSLPELAEVHAYAPLPDIVSHLSALPGEGAVVAATMSGELEKLALPSKRTKAVGHTEPESSATPDEESTDDETEVAQANDAEPNNSPSEAQRLTLPVEVKGSISSPNDTDLFRFTAKAGQALMLAVDAARSKSLLDSKLEVLDLEGTPIEQVILQATRDSWFTFRGKDSKTSDDFRVHNWGRDGAK